MNQIKLGVSVGFLSVLGYFFAYYQLWICVALLLFLLAINAETIAKQNVMQGAILSIGFSLVNIVLSKLSSGYIYTVDKIFSVSKFYEIHNVLNKLNIFSALCTLLTVFEIIVFFYCMIASSKGKRVNIPVVSGIVDRNLQA